MKCFSMVARVEACSDVAVQEFGYPARHLSFGISSRARSALDNVLEPYDQNGTWYLYRACGWEPRPPWAFVCLDREYDLAAHIAEARRPRDGIQFAPYRYTRFAPIPKPMPFDDVPKVGMLIVQRKAGLAATVRRSPLFAAMWDALRDRPARARWLVLLDPLPKDWLDQAIRKNAERWLARSPDPATIDGRYRMKWGHSNARLASDVFPPASEGFEIVSRERCLF